MFHKTRLILEEVMSLIKDQYKLNQKIYLTTH